MALTKALLDCIRENLQNAKENGHDFTDWTDYEIACDLLAYCGDFDDADWEPEDLVPYVREVRK